MPGIITGPINPEAYEVLQAECLSGSELLEVKGEYLYSIGLAVSYGEEETAFRFAGRVRDVKPDISENSEHDLVNVDVLSLNGLYTYSLDMRMDPQTGVMEQYGLLRLPIIAASKTPPVRACLYSQETADEVLGEETFGPRDIELFKDLAENQRRQAQLDMMVATSTSLADIGIILPARSFDI